ncbi:chaperone protein DnaJ [Candidatus Symbiothrix dinenymphae]|nr:chaperone protein DnaJ [Candidatus Symbiothrix dinenymphae]
MATITKRDYYEVLEVSRSATGEEIKRSYRRKAIEFHPDKNPGDKAAEDKFKEAAEAYDVLSDAGKRSRYDRFGHAGVGGAGGGGSWTMEDIFQQFGDVFAEHFGGNGRFATFTAGFGGGRGQQQRYVNRGSDLRVKVKLTLNEIAAGVEKKIKVRKYVACQQCRGRGAENERAYATCPTCQGRGQIIQTINSVFGRMQTAAECPHCNGEGKRIAQKCPRCSGEGIVQDEEIITLKIPAGVEEGMQIAFRQKGNAARRGGVNGDLHVLIEEEEHPELIRDQQDIIYNLLLTFPQAAMGASLEVPTLDGKAKIKIDPGTQPGKVLRLKNKGLPAINRHGTGDLLVNISVYVPENLTKEQEKSISDMANLPNFQPTDAAREFIELKFRNVFK